MEFTISQYNEMGFTPKFWNGGPDENKRERDKIKAIVNRNKKKEPFKNFVIDAQREFPNASGKLPSYKLYNQISKNISRHMIIYAGLMGIDLKALGNEKRSISQKLNHIDSPFGTKNNNTSNNNNNNNTARGSIISKAQRDENRRKARERTAKKARQEKQSNIINRAFGL